jgi:hypothetical protein
MGQCTGGGGERFRKMCRRNRSKEFLSIVVVKGLSTRGITVILAYRAYFKWK